MKRTIFIIHGSYGNPQENWFPWLKMELERIGHRVFVPQFQIPEGENPKYGGHKLSLWFEILKQYEQHINKDTIFVGHSRGCIFIYKVLEQIQTPIYAAFLVGPWITRWATPTGWSIVDSFHKDPFDWEKMKNGARHIEVFQSTNDEIPVIEGKEVAKNLDATLHIVENAGHFNVATDTKFKEFDLLLERIKKIL